jgi:hypothetical protein
VAATLDALDGWVADGNYSGSLGGLVLERAKLLVWLDLPLHLCLRRIWRRTWRRIRTREELWESKNRETLRNAFFSRDSLFIWTLKAHFRHRREWPARFAAHPTARGRAAAYAARRRPLARALPERHSPSQ